METELLKVFDSDRIQTGVACVRKYIDWDIGMRFSTAGSQVEKRAWITYIYSIVVR